METGIIHGFTGILTEIMLLGCLSEQVFGYLKYTSNNSFSMFWREGLGCVAWQLGLLVKQESRDAPTKPYRVVVAMCEELICLCS